jgi:hypothetical protein
MAKPKKKLNKAERREARLQKARQWIPAYEGSILSAPTAKGSGSTPE